MQSGLTLPAGLADGSIAEVKGNAFAAGSPGTLTATAVEREDRLTGDDGSESEVEGIVVGLSGDTFTVSDQPVRLTSSTTFSGAADPANARADLADGVKVEVEGHLEAGVLVAEKVKFKDGVRIQAVATGVTGGGASFTLLGKAVSVVPGRTRFDNLSAVAEGQLVEVRGYPMVDGVIFAQRVRLRSTGGGGGGGDRPFLQGVVTTKAPTTSLTILGITVNTSGSTEYRDASDAAMNAGAFYDAVTPGRTLVKAKWETGTADTSAVAREVEIEDD